MQCRGREREKNASCYSFPSHIILVGEKRSDENGNEKQRKKKHIFIIICVRIARSVHASLKIVMNTANIRL